MTNANNTDAARGSVKVSLIDVRTLRDAMHASRAFADADYYIRQCDELNAQWQAGQSAPLVLRLRESKRLLDVLTACQRRMTGAGIDRVHALATSIQLDSRWGEPEPGDTAKPTADRIAVACRQADDLHAQVRDVSATLAETQDAINRASWLTADEAQDDCDAEVERLFTAVEEMARRISDDARLHAHDYKRRAKAGRS